MQFRRRSFGRGRDFGGRGYGPREDIIKPIKVGEEYDVEIKETGSRGDGIARIKNFVVFVNDAKVGEKVRIKITEVRNKFGIGEKISGVEGETEVEDKMAKKNVEEFSEEGEPEEEEPQEEGTEEE
jgi:predicted RNA-binding protein with TRAM domain